MNGWKRLITAPPPPPSLAPLTLREKRREYDRVRNQVRNREMKERRRQTAIETAAAAATANVPSSMWEETGSCLFTVRREIDASLKSIEEEKAKTIRREWNIA